MTRPCRQWRSGGRARKARSARSAPAATSAFSTRRRLRAIPGWRTSSPRSTASTTCSTSTRSPTSAFLDGIVMGGGMGISQGAKPARRHRAHEDGHAGNQHRPVSRRRRRLLPVALSRAAGRIPRADRPHDQWRRRGGRRAGRRLRHVRRAACVGGTGWRRQGVSAASGQAGAGRPKPVGAGREARSIAVFGLDSVAPDHCGAREPIRRPGPWKPRPCCASVHR